MYYVTHGEETFEVEVEPDPDRPGSYTARSGALSYAIDCRDTAKGELSLLIDGNVETFLYERHDSELFIHDGWFRYPLRVEDEHQRLEAELFGRPETHSTGTVTAVMPGSVVEVLVEAGQELESGQPLVILEAMKMENEVLAEGKGKVKRVLVEKGDTVETDQPLIELE